jgi:hypothetical protein
MQAMTQVWDGISLARRLRVARRLSVATAMLLFTAIVAGTTGTSYAHKAPKDVLKDTVVVSNNGASFGGSIETFSAGSVLNSKPFLKIMGTNTILDIGSAPAGAAQSSLNGDITIGQPIVLIPIGFPNGFVSIFSPGSNGNSEPKNLIADPTGFDVTGIDLPQGVTYENPFDEVHEFGTDILAVANTLPVVLSPGAGEAACAAPPAGFGASVGTITEYNHSLLAPGLNIIPPFNDSPVNVTLANPAGNPATIGGCLTFLLGPVGVAFDNTGFLFAVNEGGVSAGAPGFVTVYDPGAFGNVFPRAIIGLEGPTAGDFVNPVYVTAGTGFEIESRVGGSIEEFPADVIFVTDVGDNSIKIFAPFTNCVSNPPFGTLCFGTELAVIHGGATKLKRPEGIVLTGDGNLYVVNNTANTLSEFSNAKLLSAIAGGGQQDIAPSFMLPGVMSKTSAMNFPVGVAAPQFPPPVSSHVTP